MTELRPNEDTRRITLCKAAMASYTREANYIRHRYLMGDITAEQMVNDENRAIKRLGELLSIMIKEMDK